MVEAAAVPLVALTAWPVLVEIAELKKGQKVFIQVGSGGVGSVAIQLAKHLGASVTTTNIEWAKALGADVVIDYKKQDFASGLRDYDVVLSSLGNDELHKSLQILKPDRHLVSISGPPTREAWSDRSSKCYVC